MIEHKHIKQGLLKEMEAHKFVAFASDLRAIGLDFKPGNWPKEIKTGLGNKQVLVPISKLVRGGDLKHVKYGQVDGIIQIIIYND